MQSTTSTLSPAESIVILIPVFNDRICLGALLASLDRELTDKEILARILVVDDGSTTVPEENLLESEYQPLHDIEVLELRRNLGHRRAITVGLAYIEDRDPSDLVVITPYRGFESLSRLGA
jgi:polyisoprenyl-phosphate glycosyltransferase